MRFLILLIALVGIVQAEPAIMADTYSAAVTAADGKKDLVVFVHKRTDLGAAPLLALWKSDAFKNTLARDLVALRIHDAKKPEQQTDNSGFTHKSRIYPAMFYLDSQHRLIGKWEGDMGSGPCTQPLVGGWIANMRKKAARRAELEAAIPAADGLVKAMLLVEYVDDHAGAQKELEEQLKACDPDDATGYFTGKTFNVQSFVAKLKSIPDETEMFAHFDREIAHARNRRVPKSRFQEALMKFYQHDKYGGVKPRSRMVLERQAKADPYSHLGIGALGILNGLHAPPTLQWGWKGTHLKRARHTLVFDLDTNRIDQPDTVYTITMQAVKNCSHTLKIESMAFVVDGIVVSQTDVNAPLPPDGAVSAHLYRPMLSPYKQVALHVTYDGTAGIGNYGKISITNNLLWRLPKNVQQQFQSSTP